MSPNNTSSQSIVWWGPWVFVTIFAGLAGFLTYGSATYGPPLDRAGTTTQGWVLVGTLWMVVAVSFGWGIATAARRFRR